MSALYDLTLLLDAEAPSEARTQILSDVEAQITASGKLEGKHAWGVRNLAYEIDHRTDAEYHLLQFTGPASLLDALDHSLKIVDGVVRFRIIKLDPGTPPPPTIRPESRPEPTEASAPEGTPEAPAAPEPPAAPEAPAAPDAPVAAEAPAPADAEVTPAAAPPAAAEEAAAPAEAEASPPADGEPAPAG
jgi:small subunit ribosomal protein S6